MRDIPLDRGGLFKFGNFENRKGAAKPRPLCTPLGLFLVVQGIRCSYLLTCVCMLRYSAHYAVPMLFYFFTYSVVLFWQGVCILRYSVRYALRSLALNLSLPPLAVPSPTEVPQPPLPPSHPAQRRWPKTSRAATPISHNQTTNQAATLSHNITTFTPSDTTPKHPPYKPQAAHKPPAAAQPGSWNSRPYKPRSTPYSAPYQ